MYILIVLQKFKLVHIFKVFLGGLIILLVSACDQLGFSTNIPISTELKQEFTVDETGIFEISKSDQFFDPNNTDDILGNIKMLNIDSVTITVDSVNIETNDSIPSIDALLTVSVDSINVSEEIEGDLQSLIAHPNKKLNISTDDILTISRLLSEKANNNENTIWSYNLSGTSKGAPFTVYFRLKFFGVIETFPEKII